MEPTVILFDKALSAPLLQAQLRSAEARNGPLQAIGHNETDTGATFVLDTVPTKKLTVIVAADGAVSIPVEATIVCRGLVWIEGVVKPVAIVR